MTVDNRMVAVRLYRRIRNDPEIAEKMGIELKINLDKSDSVVSKYTKGIGKVIRKNDFSILLLILLYT